MAEQSSADILEENSEVPMLFEADLLQPNSKPCHRFQCLCCSCDQSTGFAVLWACHSDCPSSACLIGVSAAVEEPEQAHGAAAEEYVLASSCLVYALHKTCDLNKACNCRPEDDMGELDFTYDDSLLQGDEEEDTAVTALQQKEQEDQEVFAVWAAPLRAYLLGVSTQHQATACQKSGDKKHDSSDSQPAFCVCIHLLRCWGPHIFWHDSTC